VGQSTFLAFTISTAGCIVANRKAFLMPLREAAVSLVRKP